MDVQDVQAMLDALFGLPPVLAYALIAAGSALENIFPPVPSDTFVILGAVLADRGTLVPVGVLLSAWLANVAGAMFVFRLAARRGPSFFEAGWGHRLLRPHQFRRVSSFYDRYGLWAVFFSRFLPVLRVVIPTFAGFTHIGFFRTLFPVAAASLLSNLVMLGAGIFASRNVGRLLDLAGQANSWLFGVAAVLIGAIGYWWFRTRREDEEDAGDPEPDPYEALRAEDLTDEPPDESDAAP
ncbi:MAG: DedA family protein [Gemmatimonadetes bacterium]|nr:DedA family protein [Gemmatimonadota bacterium]